MNIDQIVERARAADVESLYFPETVDPALSDFIGGMDSREFDRDAQDILLSYMEVPMTSIQEALADAQDERENWPGEDSPHFKARAAQIVHALLDSARNYKEIVG